VVIIKNKLKGSSVNPRTSFIRNTKTESDDVHEILNITVGET